MSRSTAELAESLREVMGEFVRATRDQAGTPSTAQSETLGLLGRHGPMSIASLAQRRRVRHQSMRLVVVQMEGDGLVKRSADPGDGRSQLIALTTAGDASLSSSRTARARQIEMALDSVLTARERAQIEAAMALIRRMLAAQQG